MNEGFQFIDIIFFAVVAGFILLRLRGVLGRRTGHQPPPGHRPGGEETNDNVVQLPDREAADQPTARPDAAPSRPQADPPTPHPGLARMSSAPRPAFPRRCLVRRRTTS